MGNKVFKMALNGNSCKQKNNFGKWKAGHSGILGLVKIPSIAKESELHN